MPALRIAFIALLAFSALSATAQEAVNPQTPNILPLQDRALVRDAWLKQRLDTVVPKIMRREGVDAWILIGGEYNEDPALKTMLPTTWLSARRTTILAFFDHGPEKGVERIAIARYPVTDLFPSAWDPESQPDQFARLAEIVAERDSKAIAINVSDTFHLGDGLSIAMHRKLENALGPLASRLIEKPSVALAWLDQRIPAEMAVYPSIVRIAHSIIDEAFSEKVITPGVTSTEDVRWYLRERIAELKLDTWFHPSVNIQRPSAEAFSIAGMNLTKDPSANIIQPGDFLHVDFGITYLGLNTDTQHHAYVLKPGETQAPKGLRDGLAAANAVQDALTSSFKVGLTGNQLLAAAQKKAREKRLEPNIYTHALGVHGHAAGPYIGTWEHNDAVPGRGDYRIYSNTAWSIELNTERTVPEWSGQKVRFMTEEDAYFDGEKIRYLDGRQTEITLIPRP